MKRLIAPKQKLSSIAVGLALAGMAAVPVAARADGVNQNCKGESVFYDPGNGEDIVVPRGFKVEVFAKGLNFPTDIAFVGNKENFKAYVLESGTGLPTLLRFDVFVNRSIVPSDLTVKWRLIIHTK